MRTGLQSSTHRIALRACSYTALLSLVYAGSCISPQEAEPTKSSNSLTEVVEGEIVVTSRPMDDSGYVESEIVDMSDSRMLAMSWADPERGRYEYATPLDANAQARVRSVPLERRLTLPEYNAMLVARWRARAALPVEAYADPVEHERGCGPSTTETCRHGHCSVECCTRRSTCRYLKDCDSGVLAKAACLECDVSKATCMGVCAAVDLAAPAEQNCGDVRECSVGELVALKTLPGVIDGIRARGAIKRGVFFGDPFTNYKLMSVLTCPAGPDPDERYCSEQRCFDEQCANELMAAGATREEAAREASWCASDCQVMPPGESDHPCRCRTGYEWCVDPSKNCADGDGNNARCVPVGTCGAGAKTACDCPGDPILCVPNSMCSGTPQPRCVGDLDDDGEVDSADCDEWRDMNCNCGELNQECCSDRTCNNDGLACDPYNKTCVKCGQYGGPPCRDGYCRPNDGGQWAIWDGRCYSCGNSGHLCCDRRSSVNRCSSVNTMCSTSSEGKDVCGQCGKSGQPCCDPSRWASPDGCEDTLVCGAGMLCTAPPPPPPKPVPPPPGSTPCNTLVVQGGNIAQARTISLGKTSGTATLHYNTFDVPDRLIVRYQGTILHNKCESTKANCPGGICSVSLPYSGTNAFMSVEVQPNCAGSTETEWRFVLGCP